ncbi:FUSC family protein [Sphaerisporangium corydalis]|uniref:FUSC family protein n=1 Tax=Sphaerisporangium corydalis TaxID=1441875 RepID=A0ABV9ESZ1_9ACTN|nr:FUSC family protein [Sphaerisporangium corydalis]
MTSSGSLRLPLPDRTAVRAGLRSFVAALGTFVTLALLVHLAHGSSGAIVVGVMVALSVDRVGKGQRHLALLARLPVVTACVAGVGAVMHWQPLLGSALFVALVFLSIHLRRYGPRAAGIGRLMTLPLLAMFMSPVPVGSGPLGAIVWAIAAGVVAVLWSLAASFMIARYDPPPPVAEPGESGTRGEVHTRLAAQAGLALALAFVAGRLLFPDHWTWTVITTLVLTVGARSRGHVLHKGVQRFAGALAGALTATLIAGPIDGHPVVSVIVIFAYLLVGLILRQVDYAYWSFCMTSVLAVLYGLSGQAGPGFLGERIVEIVLGTVCAILPAFVLLPIRTEAVVRKNLSRTLEALGDLLKGPDEDRRREFDRRAEALHVAAEPLLALRRITGMADTVLRRPPRVPGLAECARSLMSCAEPLAALTVPADDPASEDHGRARQTASVHGALRRNIGTIRLTLGRRPAPEWVPVEIPPLSDPRTRALADIDAALRSVHAGVASHAG